MTLELNPMLGRFVGHGTNHEGQKFTGTFEAKSAGPEGAVAYSFNAVGADGAIFHAESSLLGKSMSGSPALWVVSTNHPAVFERPLKRREVDGAKSSYVFGFGNPADRANFREEILIELTENSVRYVYSWGLPGGEFAERSGCTMNRADAKAGE